MTACLCTMRDWPAQRLAKDWLLQNETGLDLLLTLFGVADLPLQLSRAPKSLWRRHCLRSLLRRMSQASSVDTVLGLAKAMDQRSYETKGFQELKASIRNLSSISSMSWEAREKLPYIYHKIENDKNINSKMDARAHNLITMSNLSVHSLGGIVHWKSYVSVHVCVYVSNSFLGALHTFIFFVWKSELQKWG